MTALRTRALAVIIGAGPGVAAAVARRFHAGGHDLALLGRSIDPAAPFVADLRDAGATVSTHAVDAGDFAALSVLLSDLAAAGPVGALVYNAAAVTQASPLALSPERLMADLAVSVGGALAAARALADALAQAGGSILLTGGGFALQPMPALASLGMGKAALRNLAFSLAADCTPRGIRVGTVTILGMVQPGGGFDPDRIAEVFMALHADRAGTLGTEVRFTGEAG